MLYESGLNVEEGGSAIITQARLSSTVQGNEDVNISEHVFQVNRNPIHGVLQVRGNHSDSFTMADIANHQVAYYHDGSDTLMDEFQFSVTVRSFSQRNLTYEIHVQPVDDTPPLVDTISEAQVMLYGRVYLSRSTLHAGDSEQSPQDVEFSVVNGPYFGSIRDRRSQDR